VVQGRPWLRSVDSEHAGRGIGPREILVVEADAVIVAEGNTEAPRRPGAEAPPGA
jgi:hypothetical protein